MLRLTAAALMLLCLLSGCRSGDQALDEYNTTAVTLPDGTTIRAEVMTRREDMARGMMFRDSLPEDRGMLFIHGSPGKYPYYMFQTKVPLDIIWLDANKKVVEIVNDVPPCKSTKATECPNYGGTVDAVVVLELAAGQAARHGVRQGTTLIF